METERRNPVESFDIRGRVAVITGGSRGLGEAMSRDLATCGAKVVVVGRSVRCVEVATEIEAAGEEALPIRADLANPSDIERVIKLTVRRYGRIDILVNNAAEYLPVLPEDVDSASFDRILAVNAKAPLLLATGALPYLEASGKGAIVNVLSTAIWNSESLGVLYRASKSALLGVTMVLARNWAPRGVRVNAIAPGSFDTDMSAHLDEDLRRYITKNTPLRRMGVPQELVPSILYLVSDASSFTTGQVLRVDGGLVAA